MDSYVTLTLQDYNDLYDMAKRYLEMTQVELVETTEEWDVILTERTNNIPCGAKGKVLQTNHFCPYVKWDKPYEDTYVRTVDGIKYQNVYAVTKEKLKFINEREEN